MTEQISINVTEVEQSVSLMVSETSRVMGEHTARHGEHTAYLEEHFDGAAKAKMSDALAADLRVANEMRMTLEKLLSVIESAVVEYQIIDS